MSTVSEQVTAQRRILFGPLRDALELVAPRGPIALLGSPRSLALITDDAFGGAPVHRYAGAAEHNPRATVDEASALVVRCGCASVVAIGSSSAIDLGKAAANERDVALVLSAGGVELTRRFGCFDLSSLGNAGHVCVCVIITKDS